jgi:hypothetical protein
MKPEKPPTTSLCTHTLTSLTYGDADLVQDLMGKKTFTEVMLMQILGRSPRPVDLRITDVVLIVLMEHGLTPSAIATRVVYMSAPGESAGAVSAGLLAVGSSFVGTMENCSDCSTASSRPPAPWRKPAASPATTSRGSRPSPDSDTTFTSRLTPAPTSCWRWDARRRI